MIINRSYKYRIYPNKQQEILIQKTFGCVRFVYNYFLRERIDAYQHARENRTYYQQCHSLVLLKQELCFLKEVDKSSLQYSLRHLNEAFQRYFESKSSNESGFNYPKFKSKKYGKKSYTTSANGKYKAVCIEGTYIKFPKLGLVKARISRTLPCDCRVISATISQSNSNKYYVSILTEFDSEIHASNINDIIGIDYSSPHFYVDSSGCAADMPHFYRIFESRIKREQRRLSKMVKGSNNYKKQKIKLAKLFEKMHNCRNDWQHKESTRLSNQYDAVAVEDINYQNMATGLNLAKSTYDNSFGTFKSYLAYKLAERGKKLITINKWFPSSKLCHYCGAIYSNLTLKEREWICPACGNHIMRDENAAINIKNEGLKILIGL